MKVLTVGDFKWVNAKFDTVHARIVDESNCTIYPSEIVSIKNDERKKYVRCSYCGAIIRNNKSSIEAHRNRSHTSETCLSCPYLNVSDKTLQSKKYVKNEDGTYNIVTKVKTNLKCNNTYPKADIDSPDARNKCRYKYCYEADFKPYEDIFIKYPKVFDELATISALDKKKWDIDFYNDTKIIYKAKGIKVEAVANNYGIIEYFRFRYNSYTYNFRYSKKYDKIFWHIGTEYSESNSPKYNISLNTIRKIHRLVADVYKEGK